jgi:hypothetical protein
VNDVECSYIRAQELLEASLVGLKILRYVVEAQIETGALKSLDLGSVVVGRHQNPVAPIQAHGPDPLEQAVPSARKKAVGRI